MAVSGAVAGGFGAVLPEYDSFDVVRDRLELLPGVDVVVAPRQR
ncbi:hypothetical protein ABZ807_01790 [Micromonospora sp. NPDC047548]